VRNSTITGNGGGIEVSCAPFSIANSVISGNNGREVGFNGGDYGKGGIGSSFSLFGHDKLTNAQSFYSFTPGPTDITATSDGTNPTALNHILNPVLTRSGGPTKTHNLVKGSPAVDAVTTGCPPPTTDQRGVPRPHDAACDIGAVELVLCNGQVATLVGTGGNDVLRGTSSRDIINALGGNDRIYGMGGSDILCGSGGRDQLFGEGGNDLLNGGSDVDRCDGGSGTDTSTKCETPVNVP
jgi:Ca2+-binding RTX toxin-like protein